MSAASAACITCGTGGGARTWHFTGVTSIEHTLALNLGSTAAQGGNIVNGARNRPDRVVLSVVETDAEHSPGWSAAMLAALASLKKDRTLCRVVTSMGAYSRMLLTEIAAAQDEDNQCGWSGTLTFTEYLQTAGEGQKTAKTSTNSSVRTNTGTAAGGKQVTGTVFQQLLQRSGIGKGDL